MVSRRSESKSALMVLPLEAQDGIAMPEVSPNWGAVLCQGESGSGASLGAAIAKSDRTFRRPCDGNGVQRRLLCAERE